jgi:hypothetical protein
VITGCELQTGIGGITRWTKAAVSVLRENAAMKSQRIG